MKEAVFLQAFTVFIGIGALAFLIMEPRIEGRNAHAALFEIYFKDPFLAYAYAASTPFFMALYQAFKALGYAGKNKALTPETSKALRIIKLCAFGLIGFAALGELFILLGDSDDRAGGVFMGLLVVAGSAVIAAGAAMLERIVMEAAKLPLKRG